MSDSVYPGFSAQAFYDTNYDAHTLHVESVVAGATHYSRFMFRDAPDHDLILKALGVALAEMERKAGENT